MSWKKRDTFAAPLIEKLGVVRLLSSIAFASVLTIWAIYLESFLHNDSYVGFLIAFFAAISFSTYFFIIHLLERKNKVYLYLTALIVYVVSYLLFALIQNIIVIIILGVLTAIAASLRVTSFGILIRNKSKNKEVSKNEGFVYSLANFAWMIGPLIAGFIANKYGLNAVFLFAAFFIVMSFTLLKAFKINDKVISKRIDSSIIKVIKDFFKNKERIKSYILSGGINFWWAFIYIYVALFIINNGLNDLMLGYFLALIATPLFLSEYSFGKLTSKIGFKKVFFIGYIILAIAAISCFFISNIYVILSILIISSFGAAMIEPTTEAYFFDLINQKEREKYYGIYNTTIDVNYFLGSGLAALVLLFLPFKFVFILFGIFMLFFAFVSLGIKNIIEERRNN